MSDSYRAIEGKIAVIRDRLMKRAHASGDPDEVRHAEKCDAALNEAQVRAELLAQFADGPSRTKVTG